MGYEKILETDAFVKEATDKINKRIDEIQDDVVVLNGGRGCGKSSVLLSREKDSLNSDNLSLYQIFPSYGNNCNFTDLQLAECYYELIFSSYLLGYIRDNKQDSFSKYKKLYNEIDDKRRTALKIIMNQEYSKNKFNVKQGDYTLEIIEYLKNIFDKEKITLMIDRFDWMDNRTKISQEFISKYFCMFDKVILTTDDENYASNYPTISVDYGKDIDITVEILRRYIALNNKTKKIESEMLDPVLINDQTIKYLFNRARGNLKIMKQLILKLSYCDYDKTVVTTEDFMKQCRSLTEKEFEKLEEPYILSNGLKPKFYI